jgi:hypothetical protein
VASGSLYQRLVVQQLVGQRWIACHVGHHGAREASTPLERRWKTTALRLSIRASSCNPGVNSGAIIPGEEGAPKRVRVSVRVCKWRRTCSATN